MATIVATPSFTALTTPSLLTVAISVFNEDQFTLSVDLSFLTTSANNLTSFPVSTYEADS